MHEAQLARPGQGAAEILSAANSLLADENDAVANMANLAALLYHSLEDVNWLGFYVLRDGELVVGPFQGKPACVRIAPGRGVCGEAIERMETLAIDDVHAFPDHIACDADSASEIVIPFAAGETRALLDVDSPRKARFGADERELLEECVRILVQASDPTTF